MGLRRVLTEVRKLLLETRSAPRNDYTRGYREALFYVEECILDELDEDLEDDDFDELGEEDWETEEDPF